jgi:hypothetical protein
MSEFSQEKSGLFSRKASCSSCRPNRSITAPTIQRTSLMNYLQRKPIEGGHLASVGISNGLRSMNRGDRHVAGMTLQELGGNYYVQSLAEVGIQPKLTVGPAQDNYEIEADNIADKVMRMPDSSIQRCTDCGCDEEGLLQTKRLSGSITPLAIQRKSSMNPFAGVLESLQAAMMPTDPGKSFEAGSSIESRLSASKGGGAPLPEDFRTTMEDRFGADFSGVRVHPEDDETCHALNAEAFTHGRDIHLPSGKYQPGTFSGQRLLAHELTHVIQQTGGN